MLRLLKASFLHHGWLSYLLPSSVPNFGWKTRPENEVGKLNLDYAICMWKVLTDTYQ